jgi:hypothetical protein
MTLQTFPLPRFVFLCACQSKVEIIVCGRCCCYLLGRRSISCLRSCIDVVARKSRSQRGRSDGSRARVHIDTRDTWTRKHATRLVSKEKITDAGVRRCGWCSVRAATDGSGAAVGASPSAVARAEGRRNVKVVSLPLGFFSS